MASAPRGAITRVHSKRRREGGITISVALSPGWNVPATLSAFMNRFSDEAPQAVPKAQLVHALFPEMFALTSVPREDTEITVALCVIMSANLRIYFNVFGITGPKY